MKNVFKKVISVVLGILMFLLPAERVFARIDVVEFSDGSRLTRFAREDLQNMVDCYNEYAKDAAYGGRSNRLVPAHTIVTNCEVFGGYCTPLGLMLLILGFILLILGEYEGAEYVALCGGIPVLLIGILGCMVTCYRKKECCFREEQKNTYPWSSSQINEIKAWLISQNVAVGSSEVQPLLQGGARDVPNYFLLFERPKDKVNFDPKPFFTTDRDTRFAYGGLISNMFAGLIRDVASKLRAQGARVSDRYCLTRVGNEFHQARNVPIMPEIDSVEVVVQ